MRIFRRRPVPGFMAFLFGLVSIGVRMALVGGTGDPSLFPLAARGQVELQRVSQTTNRNSGAAKPQVTLQRPKADRVERAIPEVEEPKVIEIEYDAQGNATIEGADDPSLPGHNPSGKDDQITGLDELVASFPGGTWGVGAMVVGGTVMVVALLALFLRTPARRQTAVAEAESAEQAIDPSIAKASEQPEKTMDEATQQTYLNQSDNLTPPRTLAVIGRLLSWATLIAAVSVAGWWVYEHGSELSEKSPEAKQAATIRPETGN